MTSISKVVATASVMMSLAFSTAAFAGGQYQGWQQGQQGQYGQQTQQGEQSGCQIVARLTNPNGHICLHRGQCFELTLADNSASTGYQWRHRISPSGSLRLMTSSISSGGPMPGSPGRLSMVFRAQTRGVAHLLLWQQRPWAGGGTGPLNQITVYVY